MFKKTLFFCLFTFLSYCSNDLINQFIKNTFDSTIDIKPIQNIILGYMNDISDNRLDTEIESKGLANLAFWPNGNLVSNKELENILKVKVNAISIKDSFLAVAFENSIAIYSINLEPSMECNLIIKLDHKKIIESEQIESIAFSHDCKRLASLSSNGSIIISDIKTGDNINSLKTNFHSGAKKIMYSPDGKYLASLSSGLINILDGETTKLLYNPIIKIDDHDTTFRTFYDFAFSQDSKFIYLVGTGGVTEKFDLNTLSFVDQKIRVDEHVCSIASSLNSKYLFSAGCDGKIKIWDLGSNSLKETLNFSDDRQSMIDLLLSADGTSLVAFTHSDSEYILAFENGRHVTQANDNPRSGKIKIWKNLAFAI